MASFTDKKDYFGLTANSAPLEVIADNDGASNGYNDYKAQDGSFIDNIVYGEKQEPSNDLELTGDWTIADDAIKLGGVTTLDTKKFALGELNIETTAGELPTISASGKQVPSAAATTRYYAIPAETVKNDESAQILWGAFALTGSGCHLQSAKYKCSAELPTKDKNGFPVSFGVSQGVIGCEVEIVQCGNTAPTLEAGENWHVSDKLKCSNPDSDCPTWTATLRRFLTKTVPTPVSSNASASASS